MLQSVHLILTFSKELATTTHVLHCDDVVLPERLLGNPKLLLHKSCMYHLFSYELLINADLTATLPITTYNGYYGSVVHGGEFFVVTPYDDWIYLPPLGTQRMRMHRDGRFGPNDHTLWPQVFSEKYCHFSCIPR